MRSITCRLALLGLALAAAACGSNTEPPPPPPRAWTPERIEGGGGEPTGGMMPRLAGNLAGAAVVVWHRKTSDRSMIWASHRPAGGRWTPAEIIGEGESPAVAMEASGDALVVWRQGEGAQSAVWRRPLTSDWGVAERVPAPTPPVSAPTVATAAAGRRAIIVYIATDGIWVTERIADGTWGPVGRIDAPPAGDSLSDPDAVIDANGRGSAVWTQSRAGTPHGYAWLSGSFHVPGSAWQKTMTVASGGWYVLPTRLTVDRDSRTLFAWSTATTAAAGGMTLSGFLLSSGGVGARPLIGAEDLIPGQMASRDDGTRLLVGVRLSTGHLTATLLPVHSQESVPVGLDAGFSSAESAGSVDVALGSQGGVAVWEQRADGLRTSIHGARISDAPAWSTPELVQEGPSGAAACAQGGGGGFGPQVVVTIEGATAVWAESDCTQTDIWTATLR